MKALIFIFISAIAISCNQAPPPKAIHPKGPFTRVEVISVRKANGVIDTIAIDTIISGTLSMDMEIK